MAKFKLKFEKENKEDFLDLPVIYTCKNGKPGKEVWEEYMKAYTITRKKIDFFIENLYKLKEQLEEDFHEFEWIRED